VLPIMTAPCEISHPDANQFWQISGKRVFQQPQAIALIDLIEAADLPGALSASMFSCGVIVG
jgi:hypothetical protein